MDLLNYCRFCLSDKNILINSNCKNSDNLTYLQKIQEILPPLLTFNSNIFPSSICSKCCEKINQFYDFVKVSLNSQKILLQYNCQLNSKSVKKSNLREFICDLSNESGNEKKLSNLREKTSKEVSNVSVAPPKPKRKLYKCRLCNKNLLNIQRHILTVHTGIKRFECKICSKNFTTRDSLQYHTNVVHLNIRKYECTICKKRFGLEKFLRLHMEKRHKKIKVRLEGQEVVNTSEDVKLE